ncbi:MAG TPA: GNAT family N-acetyltransferase [Acidimicrobiales bacterium]|jgi:ribosomal protein S18 acetylase RimI-like enzyme|nr:GNAT family N-acetyltransferase [Acidimicrobiales bacterium]
MTTTKRPPAPAVDQDRALATLTTAFSADPVIRWVFPEAHAYQRAFADLARLLGGDAFAAGTAEVAPGHTGVALWVSPDAHSDDEAVASLFETWVDRGRRESVFALLAQVVDHHPTDPVWYLPFVGVDPLRQGAGIGSELVRAGLARADADGLPAYLEASTARNRALYERFGFDVVGEIRAADSPPLWPMLRPAGASR